VLAAAIPVLLFGGWVAYVTADGERTSARRTAFDTTVRVADRVQADLAAQIQVLNALAVAQALEEADLPRFYAEAQRLKAVQPLWETIELSDPAGTQSLNLLRPFGTPLGPTADRDSFDEVVRTLRPVVGGIGPVGAISGKRLVSLRVPVVQAGRLRYVLTVALATSIAPPSTSGRPLSTTSASTRRSGRTPPSGAAFTALRSTCRSSATSAGCPSRSRPPEGG
jgi:two-component system, NarL family, sensor histidine kinase UhpB